MTEGISIAFSGKISIEKIGQLGQAGVAGIAMAGCNTSSRFFSDKTSGQMKIRTRW
jgi:hypothetical protein